MVISVVIPAFNEESYLPTTLASLRDAISVCCCGVELIVVDNESSDRTREVARSFGASPRRFDLTPTWRTLIWTNPVFIALFRKRCSTWTAWYVKTPQIGRASCRGRV